MIRFIPIAVTAALFALCFFGFETVPWLIAPGIVFGGLLLLGLYDLLQTRHTLWRNFPIIGRVRWIAEALRPFLNGSQGTSQGRLSHDHRCAGHRSTLFCFGLQYIGHELWQPWRKSH